MWLDVMEIKRACGWGGGRSGGGVDTQGVSFIWELGTSLL